MKTFWCKFKVFLGYFIPDMITVSFASLITIIPLAGVAWLSTTDVGKHILKSTFLLIIIIMVVSGMFFLLKSIFGYFRVLLEKVKNDCFDKDIQ